MADQIDNVLLEDETLGLPRTIDVGNDALFLSTDLTLQAGGILVADNFKRGTANPNVSLVAGNEGDVYQRILASSGEIYVNMDGTTTGWQMQLGPDSHEAIRQLVHFIDDGPACGFASGAVKETLPAGSVFPTSFIWWESAAKTQKIVELTVTYQGVFPNSETWTMYDTDGTTVLCTVTDAITYQGPFERERTRTIT